jgi:hypothetical protein
VGLQEPVLRSVVLEFSWEPAPLFHDFRGSLAHDLRAVTEDRSSWNTDSKLVLVWNDETGVNLFVSDRDWLVSTERLDRADPAEIAAVVLPAVVSTLEIEELVEVEVSLTWLLAAETLAEAAAALERHMGSASLRDVLSPFGGRPDDMVLQYWFGSHDETNMTLRVSSMTGEELSDNNEFLTDFGVDELPPAAALVHLRRRHRGIIEMDSAIEVATRQLGQATSAGERFVATLYKP